MDIQELLHHVDHTVLDPLTTWEKVKTACDQAIAHNTATVCIPPRYVKRAAEYVGNRLKLCTVVGFPNGYSTPEVKVFETEDAIRNGADEIIYPELEVATSIAVSESSDSIFDCIRLSADYSIYELEPLERWLGKSLKELNFRAKYDLTVIAAVKGETIRPNLGPNYVFRAEEHLLVLGRIEDIRKVIR